MKKISDKKRTLIIENYKKSNSKNISAIARKHNVSKSFAWKLLKSQYII